MKPGSRKIGAGFPTAWRSSFARYGKPNLEPDEDGNFGEYAQLVACHAVPGNKTCIIRRIEISPTLRFTVDEDAIYRFPVLPDQAEELQDPDVAELLRWRWRWILGHREADSATPTFGPPGALLQVLQPDEIYPRIAGLVSTHLFHGEPQTMHGSFEAAAGHGTDTRYIVEGPSVVMLVALVSGGRLDLAGNQLELPFGNTYGSLEGVDVETDDFLRSPVRWLVP